MSSKAADKSAVMENKSVNPNNRMMSVVEEEEMADVVMELG